MLPFLPPMSVAHQLLVQVHLVTCLILHIDHPIPVIAGDHGAAKSTPPVSSGAWWTRRTRRCCRSRTTKTKLALLPTQLYAGL